MSIIQLKEANCKNCYKCIRHCDVKSITFHDDQGHILEDECVLCGKCTLICPQNAKRIESDVQKVCSMIDRGEKVYASVAPSFIAALPEGATFASLSSAMKRLGFAGIEETAIGATAVSEEYAALAEKGKMPNLITTCWWKSIFPICWISWHRCRRLRWPMRGCCARPMGTTSAWCLSARAFPRSMRPSRVA